MHLKNDQKLRYAERFWKMRSAKYETVARARLHIKTVQTSEVRGRGDRPHGQPCSNVMVDLLRRSCYAGWVVTKRVGTAARRIVTAAQKEVFQHGATLVLCGIAAGGG